MRILVTGAYGFIGSHIATVLKKAGHRVVGCGRDLKLGRRVLPEIDWVVCDFNKDTAASDWFPRLAGIDAVVNCAGVLQGSRRDDIDAIHHRAPAALFDACAAHGVKRVIQISALGVGPEAGSAYSQSKLAAELHLADLDLDWIILRPSLVYGRGCHGGTALLRGLSALPFLTPLPGRGDQRFQPIHLADLARAVARLVEPDAPARIVLNAAGPDPMTLREICAGIRAWLGFAPAQALPVPMPLIRVAARAGDALHWLGFRGSFRTTSLRQMAADNIADPTPFAEATGFMPQRFADALAAEPAQIQDRWHARLIFLRPLLRIVLGLFWFASGVIAASAPARAEAFRIIEQVGFTGGWATAVLWGGAALDIVLGGLLLAGRYVRATGTVMIVVTLGYVGSLSWTMPGLWFDPLGPLAKTLPLLPAILVLMALQEDR